MTGLLPVDGRENCDCHAHNHPSDEQGVDGKLNHPLLDHALPSAPKWGGRRATRSRTAIESPYFLTGFALDRGYRYRRFEVGKIGLVRFSTPA